MTDMNDNAAQKLNEAMAAMLADLNSQRILDCARKARLFSDLLAFERHESRPLVDGLAGDLGRLYKSVLVFERDPEVLRRNTLAMVLMSLSPLTVGIQDLLSSPDFPLWKVGMEGLVLGLEVMGTTQYLESAKLIAGTEYECNLWELEGRSMELLAGRSDAARLPAQQPWGQIPARATSRGLFDPVPRPLDHLLLDGQKSVQGVGHIS
jgi:hypothetical protein